MGQPVFSVIIPAFDEERFLPRCLDAVDRAKARLGEDVEVIVADNMSRDRTCDIARERGAKVVTVGTKCISAVRNGGAKAATGKYLVFVDADAMMSENMLVEIKRVMDTGRYVGGGTTHVFPDRWSAGILATYVSIYAMMYTAYAFVRISLFLFYTTREAFEAMGGFNEEMLAIEDWDFAWRLKKYGKKQGLKYKNILRANVVTSVRKFDEYGDWFMFLRPLLVLKAILNSQQATYELWYRPRR